MKLKFSTYKISKIYAEQNLLNEDLIMNLKTSPFSILNKARTEMEYLKDIYKRRIQAEIESYIDLEEGKSDTIQAQNILMMNKISI